MSGRRNRSTMDMGHDSFLDIVANLVGILIILVVVLGTQSQAVIERVRDQQSEEPEVAEVVSESPKYATSDQLQQLNTQVARARAAQADSDRFEAKIKQLEADLKTRQRQRGVLLDLLANAKEIWSEKQKELDQQTAEAAKRQTEVEHLKSQLANLESERKRLENQDVPVVAVEHLPTPMAKTVFGEEIHFRLKDNRLSIVPIDRLVKEIREDFQRVASGPREGRMDAAVGPVKGYVARYIMDKRKELLRSGSSVGPGTRIQLVRMQVEPLSEPYGEPIDHALTNSQTLDVELAGRQPGATTITVWVYPDSFNSFRRLKEHLYARGFATAARPLPTGRPISGGPQGSRSAAQ